MMMMMIARSFTTTDAIITAFTMMMRLMTRTPLDDSFDSATGNDGYDYVGGWYNDDDNDSYTYCSSDEKNYYNNNNIPNVIFDMHGKINFLLTIMTIWSLTMTKR